MRLHVSIHIGVAVMFTQYAALAMADKHTLLLRVSGLISFSQIFTKNTK